MTKGLKLGMLAVAFLAAMTAVVSTGKVSADPVKDTSNIVEVSIGEYNAGQTVCTGTSYLFSFDAKSEVQTGTKSGTVTCIFGNKGSGSVTLQLSGDLLLSGDNTVTIPKENVLLKNGTWTWTPDNLGTQSTDASTSVVFWEIGRTLFNHTANIIGDASGTNLEITLTVPAGQPDGTYNGTLVLTF